MIDQLEAKQKNWYTQKYNDLLRGEHGTEFCNMLDAVKDSIVNNGEDDTFKILDEYILDNTQLLSDIKSVMISNLAPFYACKILQEKINSGSISIMQLKFLFNEIFERYIIRYDGNYEETCNEIGITEKNFNDIAEAFKVIIYKGISGHLSRTSMESLFQDLSGLDEDLSEIFAELYNTNYRELQTLYIIDNINY